MTRIGFIGIGNMGGPMAANLVKAGHAVTVFDLSAACLEKAAAAGCQVAETTDQAVSGANVVITMLPAGPQVRAVYETHILPHAGPETLLLDCSTIDVETARAVQAQAAERGLAMLDAPVSGGVTGAAAGSLTFMVGGEASAFAAAKPYLEVMGGTLVHCGGPGTGQAAKICNNMMLGIQMISVAEAFGLAEKLGLAADRLFEVSSKASGQCWSLTSYCPEPGLVPSSPANRAYQPGFTAAMMLKDLALARAAAGAAGADTPLGEKAAALYEKFIKSGDGEVDFSGIITMIRNGQS